MSIVNFDKRKGKLRGKIRILSENIRKGTNYSQYQDFIERGSAYKNLREYENAVKDYSFVMSINKNLVKVEDACNVMCYRGWCYLKMDEIEKARRDFMFKCKIAPTIPSSYEDLALFYSMVGEDQNVINVCTKLLSWFKSSYAHYMRGTAFYELGRLDFSLKDLGVSLSINMNVQNEDETLTGDMFLQRGHTFNAMERENSALSDFSSAIDMYYRARNSMEKYNFEEDFLHLAFYARGKVHMKQRKFKKAIYDFSKCIEYDPESSSTSYYYNFCFRKREEAKRLIFEEKEEEGNNNDWNALESGISNTQIVVDRNEEEEMFSNERVVEEENSNSQIALIDNEEEYYEGGDDEGEFYDDKKWMCLSDERERRGW